MPGKLSVTETPEQFSTGTALQDPAAWLELQKQSSHLQPFLTLFSMEPMQDPELSLHPVQPQAELCRGVTLHHCCAHTQISPLSKWFPLNQHREICLRKSKCLETLPDLDTKAMVSARCPSCRFFQDLLCHPSPPSSTPSPPPGFPFSGFPL